MSIGSINLSKSLKNFHKRERSPSKKPAKIESINVYRTKAGLSLQPSLDMKTSYLSEKLFTCQDLKTLETTQSVSHLRRKSLKLKKNSIQIVEEKKHLVKNPVFARKSINVDKLTNLSQKESIIFNQVKNLAPPEKEKDFTASVLEPELLKAKRMRTNKFKKLSTMKKLQMSEETEGIVEDQLEPVVESLPVIKRKKLKQHIWRWVAAGGDEVY
jgi:hypothetical protein